MKTSAANIKELYSDFVSPEKLEKISKITSDIVSRDKGAMADGFYRHMMADEAATAFLSTKTVKTRLQHSLANWLERLLCCSTEAQFREVIAIQEKVGDVHSRANIPVRLVARGLRFLKHEMFRRLRSENALDPRDLGFAVHRVNFLIDVAFEEMSSAFTTSNDRDIRSEEAYRTVFAQFNVSAVREKQTAALLDWENRVFRLLAIHESLDGADFLRDSSFGLWLHHKAPLIFDPHEELAQVNAKVRQTDDLLRSCMHAAEFQLSDNERRRSIVGTFSALVEEIKFLLGSMFDRLDELETGRDELTQMFNRRFLPTILKQEIKLARQQNSTFCIALLDIDHFKRINDLHGHDAGDKVLQQVATLMTSFVRAGDFVFRYGGEEFLIILTEADADQGELICERIRNGIESASFAITDAQPLKTTVSIGLAEHEGHPDYQKMIARADHALYGAKHAGRNRVVLDSAMAA